MTNFIKLFFIFILFSTCANAQTLKLSNSNNSPVSITSDGLSYLQAKNQAVFSSNVHIIHGTTQMWTDLLIVDLNPKPNSTAISSSFGSNDLKKLTGKGNVRLKSDDGREGTCDNITFDGKTEIIVMSGNAKLTEGKNVLSGNEITIFSKENRINIKSGKERVHAIFYSDNKTKGK